MSEGLFDAVLAAHAGGGRNLQKTSTARQGEQAPQGHPWPVLHELNETYKVGALPADDESGLVLWPAAGLLRSEKLAALRMPGTIWRPCCLIWIWSICPGKCGWLGTSTHRQKEGGTASCRTARNAAASCWSTVRHDKGIA